MHDFVQSVKNGNSLDGYTFECYCTDAGELDGNTLEELRLMVLTALQIFADEWGNIFENSGALVLTNGQRTVRSGFRLAVELVYYPLFEKPFDGLMKL